MTFRMPKRGAEGAAPSGLVFPSPSIAAHAPASDAQVPPNQTFTVAVIKPRPITVQHH